VKENKFTILIPTKNRAHTLRHTLETCLSLDYENFEIIVSDDNSQDNTREVINSFDSRKIRHCHTGQDTGSMAGNWEFALNQIEDTDFVTVVGDDDGILKDALRICNNLIESYAVAAVTWRKLAYHWPDHPIDSYKNTLTICFENRTIFANSKDQLDSVTNFQAGYDGLPCLYNSVVSYDILRKVKTASGGTYFHGTSPDVYSAFANACFIEKYILTTRPLSINGASGKSNGHMQFNNLIKHREAADVMKFYSEIKNTFNQKLVMAPLYTFAVADSMLSAKDTLKDAASYTPNLKAILQRAIEENSHQDEERYAEGKKAILETAQLLGLQSYALRQCRKTEWSFIPATLEKGLKGNCLTLDATPFGVKNIMDAAQYCYYMFRHTGVQPAPAPQKRSLLSRIIHVIHRYLKYVVH